MRKFRESIYKGRVIFRLTEEMLDEAKWHAWMEGLGESEYFRMCVGAMNQICSDKPPTPDQERKLKELEEKLAAQKGETYAKSNSTQG